MLPDRLRENFTQLEYYESVGSVAAAARRRIIIPHCTIESRAQRRSSRIRVFHAAGLHEAMLLIYNPSRFRISRKDFDCP